MGTRLEPWSNRGMVSIWVSSLSEDRQQQQPQRENDVRDMNTLHFFQ